MKKLLLVLLSFSLFSCGYNSLQGLDEDVKASWADVENNYQRRADLIPNLVETVKGFAKQERETLEAVVKARSEATQTKIDAGSLSDAKSFEKFEQAQGQLSSALSRLLVVVEKYPDLKSNQNFIELQAQLEGTENRIAVSRKRYIETVAEFNKQVRFFPTNLTAKFLLGMQPRETFKATAPNADKAPEVKF
jgi:LemA protein